MFLDYKIKKLSILNFNKRIINKQIKDIEN